MNPLGIRILGSRNGRRLGGGHPVQLRTGVRDRRGLRRDASASQNEWYEAKKRLKGGHGGRSARIAVRSSGLSMMLSSASRADSFAFFADFFSSLATINSI